MDRLPTELLKKIFQQLLRKTLYQCTLVCSQWVSAAEECLYQVAKIHRPTSFYIFMNTVLSNLSKRNHVTTFTLFSEPIEGLDIKQVLTVFPNLRTARLFNSPPITIHDHPTVFPLTLDLCPSLETLELSLRPVSGERRNINPINELCSISMPVLKKLTLCLGDCILKIEDVERLHQAAPSIRELHFNGATVSQSEDLNDITPSVSTKSITWHFGDISNLDEYLRWFRYIQKKYPHLETISIGESYCCRAGIDINKLFEDGWSPLLRSIGPQLKTIYTIDAPSGVNVFKVLDESRCKVENLSLCSESGTVIELDDFAQSSLRHQILELRLESVHPRHEISLKGTKLVTLSLYYTREQTLLLNTLLKLCPDTLETLFLDNVTADIDEDDDFQSSITSIEVNFRSLFGSVEPRFEEKLKKLCPNLKSQYIST